MSMGRAPGTCTQTIAELASRLIKKTFIENCSGARTTAFLFQCTLALPLFLTTVTIGTLHRTAMSNITILVGKIATSQSIPIQGEFQSSED